MSYKSTNMDILKQLKLLNEPFFEKGAERDGSKYILFGAPLDKTASYRSGSRFAPTSIRNESQFLEGSSVRTGLEWEDLLLYDAGDLMNFNNCNSDLEAIQALITEIMLSQKISIMLGGEHTITLGALRSIKPDTVIIFDAHLDLRDELFGERISHATYLRRAYEELDFKLLIIGVRAFSSDERKFALDHGIEIIDPKTINDKGALNVAWDIKNSIRDSTSVYVSLDMDAIDPAEAPAVGNQSPEGMKVAHLLDILGDLVDDRLRGFDLVEVVPSYDSGLTSIQASYITLETL